MPTRQGSRLAKKLNPSLRLSCLRSTTFPCSSTPCTCNSDFAKSTPIVVIFIRALLSFSVDECISTLAPRCRLGKGASIPLLAHRHARDHAVDQVGSALRHAPRPARRAEPAPLTGEGHQLLVRALRTTQAQKPVGEDATLEKGIELVFYKVG